MSGQDMDEPEQRPLDVLTRFIALTEARHVDQINRLRDLLARGESITEAMRVLMVIENALGRLIVARDLLVPSELSV